MNKVEIIETFSMPVEALFEKLSEHENLEQLFAPVKVTRISDGDGHRNGVGSARKMQLLIAPPFVETVTAFEENKRIEYKITEGSPLKNHHGTMLFEPNGETGSKLHYTITFEGKLPFVGNIIEKTLDVKIRQGLKSLA